MKHCKEALLLALAVAGLASCSDDNPWVGKERGGINLHLDASADVTDAAANVRAGAPELVAPDVADFAIELRDMDTDRVQRWNTLTEFNSEAGFDVGTYTLTASYGNLHECGFDKPYFLGETQLSVLEGRETEVSVTAQLANSMVSIEYTDAFRNYFPDYRISAHTKGEAYVTFYKGETRPAFLAPGEVVLDLAAQMPGGAALTDRSPAAEVTRFNARPRHHYHITFDVNADPVGSAQLTIIFDDTLQKENVTISLSDELFTSEGPILTAEGFTDGVAVEALSGHTAENPLKFETICKGGIESVLLTIAGDFTPPFGREVELVNAPAELQTQLENFGITAPGLFKNPAEMAIINVSDLPRYLPEGNFEISVKVKDRFGRVSAPVTLPLTTRPIVLEVLGGSALYQYPGSAITQTPTVDATVTVTYNGLHPQESISFMNRCRSGVFKECDVVSVEESTRTRSFVERTYIFHIRVCDAETSPLPMKMFFNGEQRGDDFTISVIEPEYTLTADAFATYARVKVDCADASQIPTIVNGMNIYLNGSLIDREDTSVLTLDAQNGFFTINGLTPDTEYTVNYCLTTRPGGVPSENLLTFRTEAAAQIENGDFSQTERLHIENLQVGGPYQGWPVTYHNSSSIDRQVPSSWATINPKTANENASNKNTWFIVPSTYVENGQAIIRNVGYSSNGVTPDRTGGVAGSTNYCTNAASFADDEKVAGELFLGSYTFDSTTGSIRVSGIPFTSRPKSLSFDYKYQPEGTDTGVVSVILLDGAGTQIASRSMDLVTQANMTTRTITFPAYAFGRKVARIRIEFKSSKSTVAPIHIPSGSELNEGFGAVGNHTISANEYHAVATGSVLTVDNVKLNY